MTGRLVSAPREYEPWSVEYLEDEASKEDRAPKSARKSGQSGADSSPSTAREHRKGQAGM